MRRAGFFLAAALICLPLASLAAGSQPSHGFLGRTLSDLAGTDFFTFFHLSETGRTAKSNNATEVTFQPPGMFHDLARVVVALDAAGKTTSIEARLDRGFVEASMGTFARDMIKSLIRQAPATADEKVAASLADEIESRRPGPAMMTVDGKSPKFERRLSTCTVFLENTVEADKKILIVAVR